MQGFRAAAVIVSALISTGIRAGDPVASSADTLVPVQIRGFDQASLRPGATLAAYDKILLDEITVSFSKNWRPNDGVIDPWRRVTGADRERIVGDLAALARERFIKVLGSKGGYPVVAAPEAGALHISARIEDLYINAPDVVGGGRSRSYVRSAGSMTLVAELRDARTGELIARVRDRRVDPDSFWLMRADSVTNSAAAQRALDAWAFALRAELDAAHRNHDAPSRR